MILAVDWTDALGVAVAMVGVLSAICGVLVWLVTPRINDKIESVSVKMIRQSEMTIKDTVNGKLDGVQHEMTILTAAIERLDRTSERRNGQVEVLQRHVDRLTTILMERQAATF